MAKKVVTSADDDMDDGIVPVCNYRLRTNRNFTTKSKEKEVEEKKNEELVNAFEKEYQEFIDMLDKKIK